LKKTARSQNVDARLNKKRQNRNAPYYSNYPNQPPTLGAPAMSLARPAGQEQTGPAKGAKTAPLLDRARVLVKAGFVEVGGSGDETRRLVTVGGLGADVGNCLGEERASVLVLGWARAQASVRRLLVGLLVCIRW
jgi:hypothetical protein